MEARCSKTFKETLNSVLEENVARDGRPSEKAICAVVVELLETLGDEQASRFVYLFEDPPDEMHIMYEKDLELIRESQSMSQHVENESAQTVASPIHKRHLLSIAVQTLVLLSLLRHTVHDTLMDALRNGNVMEVRKNSPIPQRLLRRLHQFEKNDPTLPDLFHSVGLVLSEAKVRSFIQGKMGNLFQILIRSSPEKSIVFPPSALWAYIIRTDSEARSACFSESLCKVFEDGQQLLDEYGKRYDPRKSLKAYFGGTSTSELKRSLMSSTWLVYGTVLAAGAAVTAYAINIRKAQR